ncbi:MAG: hypothetical protein IT330_17070 [Anaerolineae bacterium]|nr:hypothetical protein [Anaerolineae bacterium]
MASVSDLPPGNYLIAVEGGGTKTQAALFAAYGELLQVAAAADVNVNFTTPERAISAIVEAVKTVLQKEGIAAADVRWATYALVTTTMVAERAFALACPQATLLPYNERDVVFARAGHYRPHGVAVVAGTGATAWAVRQDDGRQVGMGGWGSLLGDEGSAYAIGLSGLRAVAQAWEGREAPTRLVEAACQFYDLPQPDLKSALIHLTYQKPLSRTELAAFAREVTRLAAEGDDVARRIVGDAANDLAALALHATRHLFHPHESFVVVIAGGLLNAGELVLGPLRAQVLQEFSHATVEVGSEQPAIALGRLALHHLSPS